jgi:hypothetical protein
MPTADTLPKPNKRKLESKTANGKPRIVAKYDYCDEVGNVLFQVVRFDPKDFRQRKPNPDGGWQWKVEGVRVVPYRLRELLAEPTRPVVIVEGEKDADTLAGIGLVVTCNAGGAGKWLAEHSEFLRGRIVIIIPDNDEAGRNHAQQVAQLLHGIAESVRIVELPGTSDKGDVSDWIAAGGTASDLLTLANNTPEWNPSSQNSVRAPIEGDRAQNEFSPIPASQLGNEDQIDWLWHGWLARGYITLLVGLWKAGKSTLLAHLLHAFADCGDIAGSICTCKVLVVTEEGKGIWARRRADLGIQDNVEFVIRPFKGQPGTKEWERFVEILAESVQSSGFDVVVIDPWQSISPVWDENDAAQTMRALTPFYKITESGAAVLLMHHPRKGDANQGQASRGSGALPGFVDIICELRRFNPEQADDTRRVLKGLARFDETLPETVIELRDDGYHVVGSKADAKQLDRIPVIEKILVDSKAELTSEDVFHAWPEHKIPRPSKRSVQLDLNYGFSENRWNRSGEGKKGDPFRYSKCDSRTL